MTQKTLFRTTPSTGSLLHYNVGCAITSSSNCTFIWHCVAQVPLNTGVGVDRIYCVIEQCAVLSIKFYIGCVFPCLCMDVDVMFVYVVGVLQHTGDARKWQAAYGTRPCNGNNHSAFHYNLQLYKPIEA